MLKLGLIEGVEEANAGALGTADGEADGSKLTLGLFDGCEEGSELGSCDGHRPQKSLEWFRWFSRLLRRTHRLNDPPLAGFL